MYTLQQRYELEENQIQIHQPDQISPNLSTHETTTLPLINSSRSRTSTDDDLGKKLQQNRGRSSFQQPIKNNNRVQQEEDEAKQNKRIQHRDIERQRRQEMASLYASLRSLLPLEYVKGKRAVCDHMQEAVNYIKCLQTNIIQLQAKRDRLLTTTTTTHIHSSTTTAASLRSSRNVGNTASNTSCCIPVRTTDISVIPCTGGGLEILISTRPKQAQFPLSRVLKLLLSHGLDVVSCVSTTVHDLKLHKIHSQLQVTDGGDQSNIDIMELQQKLTNLGLKGDRQLILLNQTKTTSTSG
ncbi:OLC1v1027319C1 [Oldenlandia corymbosa var. corymbosa]|uniref:OLC1v1027319C1 n=1 Tax=Oldenlandia corymbosa var. corymbosa TaxID=529605 RepID=A0AAV1C953_OLDCO|nr:OLC1v1027319C1 [Oldenlandia corymbosa var. corymbosa]